MKSPVVLTGGTGYLGSNILKQLLERDYTVHLTSRNPEKSKEKDWIKALKKEYGDKLLFFPGDLLEEGSFDAAMKGASGLIHAASPFKIDKIKDAKKELVDPAVEGTKNVLTSADEAGTIEKVVLTSSVAAVYGDAIDIKEHKETVFSEKHWNTSSSISHQPYSYSKVSAEREAWALNKGKSWKLITINPGFIVGPAVAKRSDSTSIQMIIGMLSGRFKTGVPDLHFAMVDVRDVAKAHILALESETAEGRHICVNGPMSMLDLANTLQDEVGDKFNKIPKKTLPKWLTYLVGPFMAGFSWSFLRNNLGIPVYFDNSKIKKSLGIEFTSIDKSLKDHADQLQKDDLV
jgi:nucleoside-diphosphate-sugar epimerase